MVWLRVPIIRLKSQNYYMMGCCTKMSMASVAHLIKHFASVGKRVQDGIVTNSSDRDPLSFVPVCKTKLKFRRITEQRICKIVDSMQPKTSSGVDYISNMLLKKIVSVLKCQLCTVFNKSIEEGVYPDLMKIAKVIPLYKSGDVTLADNYRPISMLPVISKILERHIYDQIMLHLNVNDILYSRQFGFRKKHSTTDAVVNFVGEVLSAFDGSYTALSVFVDLRKAFDTVSHSLILAKLNCIGICDKELQWFTNYLTNRRQLVQLGGCLSDMATIAVGVPQGSLLGVLLFEILINDVVKSLKFCSSILYADDTTLFLIGRSV